ncbi:MAG: methyltransferase domain-containing protein [Spirochaetes bacterium]|nr:methyltransferase domain-containing protein [Spirochaetota bacterium]
MDKIIEQVKDYYGKQLQSTKSLQSSCCTVSPPPEVRSVLPYIADEIKEKFYGCGSPLPPLLRGMAVLDLGCGTGRDVYIASKLVGESGHVIGVDMTTEQIEIAKKYQEEQRKSFGYDNSNVTFHQGYIEDLKSIGIEDNSIDVVISNCVINLSPNKEQVFREIFRVLKPGGELYFSDIFADRRIPEELAIDPVLRCECLGGALYVEDFRRLMTKIGWADFRYTSVQGFDISSENIKRKIGFVTLTSRTVRAFKLEDLEDICEDYGQVAYYNGLIPGHTHFFDLDDHHRFFKDRPMLVCGNTASMLSNTRFAKVFKVTDRITHFGAFAGCGSDSSSSTSEAAQASSSCAPGCC